MITTNALPAGNGLAGAVDAPVAAGASATAWGAIFAGAAGSAALALILLILGTGLGLSSVSPFAGEGASAITFGVSTILWLTFTQIAASGLGGYLAGRLRTRWHGTPTDEVYFRDTAHGFLSWAIATLVTAAVLSSAIGAIVSGGAKAGAAVAGGASTIVAGGAAAAAGPAAEAAKGAMSGGNGGYFVDSLFRRAVGTDTAPAPDASASAPMAATGATTSSMSAPTAPADAAAQTAEAGRIFLGAVHDGALPPEDARYLGQMVAQRTGLSQADAEKRVNDAFTKMKAKADQAEAAARDAADKARKASAYGALWMFITLLIGAFSASFAATFGGRQRDTF